MKGGFSRKRKLGKALSGGLLGQLLQESGKTISDADRARLQAMMGSAGVGAGAAAALGESGKSMSNADRARIQELLGSMKSPRPKTDRQLMQFEDGGKVKKPKTLPKPKPKMTKAQRIANAREANAGRLGEQDQKMKKGGAAFPDLTGDGKVTQKDILKGRGVKGFEEGGAVRGMGRAYMGASRKAKIR